MTNIVGFKNSNTQKIKYANVSSVTKLTLSCNEYVKHTKNFENIEVVEKNVVSALKEIAIETYSQEECTSDSSASNFDDNDEDEFIPRGQQKKPEFYTEESLNDLIRDLGLPKDAAEHLASYLKKRNLVMKGTQSIVYRSDKFVSIPIAHSTILKDSYVNMEKVLSLNKYSGHNWMICGNLKIVTILLGQQSGFTKHPC